MSLRNQHDNNFVGVNGRNFPNIIDFNFIFQSTYTLFIICLSTNKKIKVLLNQKYIIYNGTLQIAPIKLDLDRTNPRVGILSIEYSCSGQYLSRIHDIMPNLLFIFDFKPTKRDHLAL
ncbi:unnamed protein product [Rotaria sp. Silwood1]|nr:unnamed protein product [Rotaria sp. Silwood1]